MCRAGCANTWKFGDRLQIAWQNTRLLAAPNAAIWCRSPNFFHLYRYQQPAVRINFQRGWAPRELQTHRLILSRYPDLVGFSPIAGPEDDLERHIEQARCLRLVESHFHIMGARIPAPGNLIHRP